MANKKQISDELLAAFLEGNVNEKEMTQVLLVAKTDAEVRETLDIALQLDEEERPQIQIAAEGGRNLCDVQCEAIVLRRFGFYYDVDELLEVAKEYHWIRKEGTPLNCIGNLMNHQGLIVSRKYDATINDVKEALERNYGIIVAVDSDKLYPERPDEEDATNHAIVVTGIDVDNDIVRLFDPANVEESSVSMSLFMSAWQESRCYLICATTPK